MGIANALMRAKVPETLTETLAGRRYQRPSRYRGLCGSSGRFPVRPQLDRRSAPQSLYHQPVRSTVLRGCTPRCALRSFFVVVAIGVMREVKKFLCLRVNGCEERRRIAISHLNNGAEFNSYGP